MNDIIPITDAVRRFDILMREMQDFQSSIFSDPFFATPRKLWKSSSALPKINVRETEQEYMVEAAVPGYSKDQIRIYVEDGRLHIDSEVSSSQENEDKGYIFKELSSRSFSRSIPFPTKINEEKIEARLDDGMLVVKVPKMKTELKSKQIKIS